MHVAKGAVRDAPGIALEPCVLRGRLAAGRAASGFAKAADVEGDPMGIGEAVFVTALHDDALVLMRDGVTAGGAEEAFFFLWLGVRFCFGFLLAARLGNGIEAEQGGDERVGHGRRAQENSVSTPVKPYSRLCEISPFAKKPTSGMSPSSWRMVFSSTESSPNMCAPRPRQE